ncbi:leucyl/phenylalanyl-tRNA--protein transferase [Acidithiobacillus ferriphilus]|uniref:leucyl/phenylalanyl-tRNA--protein transferase n=1 Tax=Acidithiobacillus ferriphilus TaxID=1689834 RepID=UPI00232CC4E1|nr:leucyl/phenylalanyl-tRNA--protein transferase [Acidithiobacillus ferriphilus]WCE93573.1 leucyl/phenylalanyl-tRNA--protein transferase [Acidithiobacillus ferriphilus]
MQLRPEGVCPVLLRDYDRSAPFPDPEQADGNLIAIGGDLSRERLLRAYAQGIFPWFAKEDPILWWCPDPRAVLEPSAVHISRSLRKSARNGDWQYHMDSDFVGVIDLCAEPRAGQSGTWITPAVRAAYLDLFAAGAAHSLEVYQRDRLVGGLYGVALGGLFFGESMFSRVPDASKLALVLLARHLQHWGFGLIDTQFITPHLQSMGAREWTRSAFLQALADLCTQHPQADWKISLSLHEMF